MANWLAAVVSDLAASDFVAGETMPDDATPIAARVMPAANPAGAEASFELAACRPRRARRRRWGDGPGW
ncbi:hypothetical protein [Planosporangium mesophilum]|uniref:Uncharacterized protein n=1 Tax=Planosporangium mesophilum TaxID=689768 RepID=A0A8J3TES7_9ACTN|nr:hypothetical protein [Planosporangium mesophilum]NJC86628.1 hypothetical protein [Planosporangium mesophilum]GII25810.1 hypothetical protein Pme01_54070 [Planosporangium mesophilum]